MGYSFSTCIRRSYYYVKFIGHDSQVIDRQKTTRWSNWIVTLWLPAHTHLAGNLLIFVGPEAFNYYAHKLTSNPLIYVAEAILAAIFLGHMGMAIKVTMENKAARPEGYYMKTKTGRGSTFASSTMPYTGLILLAF